MRIHHEATGTRRKKNTPRRFVIISGLLTIATLIFFPTRAFACFISPLTVDVPSDFEVLVADHGKPVGGIPIEVFETSTDNKRALFSTQSDKNGRVQIQGLRAGEYSVESRGAIWVPGFIARVGNSKARMLKREVEFQWPLYQVVYAKNLRGRLWSANPQAPFEAIELQLLPVDGGKPIQIQQASEQGRFDFGQTKPGLYVLKMHAMQKGVAKEWEPDGPIAVRISPDSPSTGEDIQLPIGMTSCGINYVQCAPSKPLTVSSRAVLVLDEMGARVSGARFTIQDDTGRTVASGQSGKDGLINLPSDLKGLHKMDIYSSGFTPLEVPLQVEEFRPHAEALKVLLNIAGTCSRVSLEKHAP